MDAQITLRIPAKINLSLDITGRRADGYHTLRSVFQTVGLYDRLTVAKTDADTPLSLACDTPGVPCDRTNLVWRAAELLLGGNPRGIRMQLEKGIPSQAGMGGGSADCAAALLGIRRLLGLPVTDEELHTLAAGLGADVPFFLRGGTVLCEGIGERMTPLAQVPPFTLILAKGEAGISTPAAYRALDALTEKPNPATDGVLAAIAAGDRAALFAACGNEFDAVTDLPEIVQIRTVMRRNGIRPVLSGSGAAVFGGCTGPAQAEQCAEALRAAGIGFVRVAQTDAEGIRAVT